MNYQMQFGKMISEKPNFNFFANFFQLYHFVVAITEKYNGDLQRRTSYKIIKSFQLFYEGQIKTKELCTTKIIMFILK